MLRRSIRVPRHRCRRAAPRRAPSVATCTPSASHYYEYARAPPPPPAGEVGTRSGPGGGMGRHAAAPPSLPSTREGAMSRKRKGAKPPPRALTSPRTRKDRATDYTWITAPVTSPRARGGSVTSRPTRPNAPSPPPPAGEVDAAGIGWGLGLAESSAPSPALPRDAGEGDKRACCIISSAARGGRCRKHRWGLGLAESSAPSPALPRDAGEGDKRACSPTMRGRETSVRGASPPPPAGEVDAAGIGWGHGRPGRFPTAIALRPTRPIMRRARALEFSFCSRRCAS